MVKKVVKFASPYAYSAADDSDAPPNTTSNTTPSKDKKEKEKEKQAKSSHGEGVKEADVNVICLELGQISQQGEAPITGDPVFCSNVKCKAVFNSFSKLEGKAGKQQWTCEFCNNTMEVHLDDAEIPKNSEVDYILEPVLTTTTSTDDSSIIFCIDTSGSMCVTCEVEAKEPIKTNEKKSAVSKFVEHGANQRLPNEKKNVQYVSRLQSVQTAVISQLEALSKSSPNKKIGIVTFNDDVKVIGDGTQDSLDIAGDKLGNYTELLELGNNYALKTGLDKSKNKLIAKMQSLEEQGGTALGPALLVSCAIAGKKPGSKVIICTDGLANIGLGALDSDAKEKSVEFYDELATYAKSVGVTVSVITIAGNECSLENLGKVADATGGEVDIVDPRQIASNFASMLEKRVIATNVDATLVAHPAIRFENGQSFIKKEVGNINLETETTFEYSVNSSMTTKMKAIPFQVQIGYRRTDGPLCVRVITVQQPVTSDRALAEKDVDVLVIGVHVSKKSASLVQDGNYDGAREAALAHKRMLQRAVHTKEQKELMVQFDNTLAKAEDELDYASAQERAHVVMHAVDDVNNLDRVERSRMRSAARDDRTAAVMYQMKGHKAAGCVVQ